MSTAATTAAPDYRLGLVLVTLSAIAWSTAGLFTRLLSLDGWTMLAWRGVFGALGIFAVIVTMRRAHTFRDLRSLGLAGWLYAGVSAIGMIFFITSLRYTTVAHVAVIYATVPFVAALLAWIAIGEIPGRRAVVASCAALVGVVLMVGLASEGSGFGDLLALGMTVSMALMMVITRRYRDIATMPTAALSALMSSAVCWPFGTPLTVTGSELTLLALFGLINSALGLALFTIGSRLLPAVETALICSLDAPLAPLWVWLAFGETPDPFTLIGGGIVLLAVFLHVMAGMPRATR